jgi:hypothetical protein
MAYAANAVSKLKHREIAGLVIIQCTLRRDATSPRMRRVIHYADAETALVIQQHAAFHFAAMHRSADEQR